MCHVLVSLILSGQDQVRSALYVILCLRCNLIFADHIETESLVNAINEGMDMKIYNFNPKVQKSSKEHLQNLLNPANNLEEFGVRMM